MINALLVPDFGRLAKLALEHANGARAADVVGHEHVGIHPDVVTGLHPRFAGGAGENFFRQCHNPSKIAEVTGEFNCANAAAKTDGASLFQAQPVAAPRWFTSERPRASSNLPNYLRKIFSKNQGWVGAVVFG